MISKVHPFNENQINNNDCDSDNEENVRLSQRRGAIKAITKNKEYEKYKCNLCKKNDPFFKCPKCELVVCKECTTTTNICNSCEVIEKFNKNINYIPIHKRIKTKLCRLFCCFHDK